MLRPIPHSWTSRLSASLTLELLWTASSHFSDSVLVQKLFGSLTNLQLLFRVQKTYKDLLSVHSLFQRWHLNRICKAAFFHLCNIARIRKVLPQSGTGTLIHAFVSLKIDYCNALLAGCPNSSLKWSPANPKCYSEVVNEEKQMRVYNSFPALAPDHS